MWVYSILNGLTTPCEKTFFLKGLNTSLVKKIIKKTVIFNYFVNSLHFKVLLMVFALF